MHSSPENTWMLILPGTDACRTLRCAESLAGPENESLHVAAVIREDEISAPLRRLHQQGALDELIILPADTPPSREMSAAIRRFADFLEGKDHGFAGWVSGDMILTDEWFAKAIGWLEDGPPGLEVICLPPSCRQAGDTGLRTVQGEPQRQVRERGVRGAAWLFPRGFFARHGTPPASTPVAAEEARPENHYSRVLAGKGLKFGVVRGCAEPIATNLSKAGSERDSGGREVFPAERVAIDARTVEPHMRGIGLYTYMLIRALTRICPEREFLVLHSPEGEDLLADLPGRVQLAECPVRLGDSRWEREVGDRWCRERGIDIYHGTSYGCIESDRIPTVATVHDVSFLRFPGFYPDAFVERLSDELRHTLAHADRIITVSRHVGDCLISALGVAASRVVAVHSGPGQFAEADRCVGDRSHLVALDPAQPRKNVSAAIEAFAELVENSDFEGKLALIAAGWEAAPRLKEECRRLGILDRVRITGEVGRPELARLYANALALLYPSFDEGFGFPALEAMTLGTPVIASRAGSLPEVCGDAALYVDPERPEEIAAAVRNLIRNPDLASRMVEKGQKRAQQFSWEACARGTLEVYGEAFEEKATARRRGAAPCLSHSPRVAMVTPWNVPCPVTEATRPLVESLRSRLDVIVLSQRGERPPEEGEERAWERDGDLNGVLEAARSLDCSAVHLQYHPDLFTDVDALSNLLWELKLSGVATVVTVHDMTGTAPAWMLIPDLVVAENRAGREFLTRGGMTTPCVLIPPSLEPAHSTSQQTARVILKTVGLLHPNRGHWWGLEVLSALKDDFDADYHVVGPLAEGYEEYPDELRRRAQELGVEERFALEVRRVPAEKQAEEWREADVALLPFQYPPIGSNAAVLGALSAGIPAVASDSDLFEDLGPAILTSTDQADMARNAARILSEADLREEMARARQSLVAERSPELTAERHHRAYREALGRRRRVSRRALDPWISVHIVAKENSALGLEMYRSALQSLNGYPDEFVVVDNGSSPAVHDMVREELHDQPATLVSAPQVESFAALRNIALEHTSPRATHVQWVDTDEVFFPSQLPRLKEALRDPDISIMHLLLLHFIIDPASLQDRQINRAIFRMGPDLRWAKDVHEVPQGVPSGRQSFIPVKFLHFGYVRPQWRTCLKWLRYARLEYGNLDRYKWKDCGDGRRPWFGDEKTPDTILEERGRSRYTGTYPASCARWLEPWRESGLPWREYLKKMVDHSPWERWTRLRRERGSWEATLEEMLAAYEGASQPEGG